MALFRRDDKAAPKPAPPTEGAKPAAPRDWAPFWISGGLAFLMCLLTLLGRFDALDLRWNDQLFRWRGPENADKRVVVVTIDDESIKKVGQYPWLRGVYARLIRKLFARGVKVVALDVMFYEPSFPKEDQALIDVTREFGKRVVHAGNMDPENTQAHSFRRPFAALDKVAKSVGSVDQLLIDEDGSVRATYLMYGKDLYDVAGWLKDPARVPALGLRALSVYDNKPPDEYLKKFSNRVYLNTRGQSYFELLDPNTHRPINVPKFAIPRVQTWRVLQDQLDEETAERLKGAIVLLGYTASGTYDHFPSPFIESQPGVEVHANLIDNLLNDRTIREPYPPLTLLLCFVFAFAGMWLVGLHPLTGALLAIAIFGGWTYASFFLFKRLQLVNFIAPSLSFLGTYAILIIRRTLSEQAAKRAIQQTFGRFVSPDVVKDLAANPEKAKIGAQERVMTVMFLDIAHFTTISEKLTSNQLFQFLNEYLSALTEVIETEQRGTVDKYIGDCIMAFWNAPLDQSDHRAKACIAAVRCQEVMAKLNAQLDANPPLLPFKLHERPAARIGVNAGTMNVGFTGSRQKLQYTVLGDEVNLGSRLEGANKFFGSAIMVSQFAYEGGKDVVEGRILGEVRVVGKSIPIKVYELLALKGQLSPAWREALPLYEKGIELFLAEKFQEAKEKFARVLELVPDDKPCKLYFNACDDYIAIPPLGEWRVFNLTTK